jgi:DNA-binding beta-propeller fold protein YncE
MLGSVVYDAALNAVDSITTADWRGGGAALSPDGTLVYVSTTYGYAKIRLSDGVILEQVKLGTTPGRMIVTPDGNRLIMVATRPGNSNGQLAIIVVDLR